MFGHVFLILKGCHDIFKAVKLIGFSGFSWRSHIRIRISYLQLEDKHESTSYWLHTSLKTKLILNFPPSGRSQVPPLTYIKDSNPSSRQKQHTPIPRGRHSLSSNSRPEQFHFGKFSILIKKSQSIWGIINDNREIDTRCIRRSWRFREFQSI